MYVVNLAENTMRRTKEDAELTKQTILKAAVDVFTERGVAKASLEEIARKADVTRGAVYWHFKNKMEIFDALHENLHTPLSNGSWKDWKLNTPILSVSYRSYVRTYSSISIKMSNYVKHLHFSC